MIVTVGFFFALDPEAGVFPPTVLPVGILETGTEDFPAAREDRGVERALFRLSVMDALSQNEPLPG